MLLAERLRRPEEKNVIKEVLEKHMKNVKINEEEIYSRLFEEINPTSSASVSDSAMVWNQPMRRCPLSHARAQRTSSHCLHGR